MRDSYQIKTYELKRIQGQKRKNEFLKKDNYSEQEILKNPERKKIEQKKKE